jgi:energy-coupling factor transporter ATP-binding protein EcfA2
LDLPVGMPLIWTGHAHNTTSIKWYNPIGESENIILIADDILIKHLPTRNLTICSLSETKLSFFKARRPLLSNYIFFLIHSIASMYGKYCIHASCVARGKYAYLFTGQSGSGKTTISEILGEAGWEYMGDDLVFISQDENGEIVVDSFLCKAKIFNARQTAKDAIDVIGERNFNYAYRKKLGGIINLQRTEATKKSILIPASQAEAFTWLVYAGNNIKIQYHRQQWMDICEKASSLPAYTLMFADKAYFTPSVLDTILQ